MSNPRVVGIDLSLTSTGLADSDHYTDRIRTKAAPGVPATVTRLHTIREAVSMFASICATSNPRTPDAVLAVIEGPSYGSSSTGQHTRGGLWWVVAADLVDHGVPILVVPPTVRAKYATGRGNAGKDEVLAAAIKQYTDWDITGNDVADAVVLMAIGRRLLGHPVDDLPKVNLTALAKLEGLT